MCVDPGAPLWNPSLESTLTIMRGCGKAMAGAARIELSRAIDQDEGLRAI
jgi:hypothetical protein